MPVPKETFSSINSFLFLERIEIFTERLFEAKFNPIFWCIFLKAPKNAVFYMKEIEVGICSKRGGFRKGRCIFN